MTSNRVVLNKTSRDYQPGSQDGIDVPLNMDVDMCSLVVTIRARNSAGMSFPTEIEVGRSHPALQKIKLCINCRSLHADCPTMMITDSPDNSPTTSTGTEAITLDVTDEPQQGDNIATLGT